MKTLLLAIMLVGAAAFLHPLSAEGTPTPCAAFERRVKLLAGLQLERAARTDPRLHLLRGLVLVPVPPGLIAEAYAIARFPALAPPLACTLGYWALLLDSELSGEAFTRAP